MLVQSILMEALSKSAREMGASRAVTAAISASTCAIAGIIVSKGDGPSTGAVRIVLASLASRSATVALASATPRGTDRRVKRQSAG